MGAISEARKEKSPIQRKWEQLRDDLAKMRSQLKKVIPQHVTVNRIERIILNECRRNPKLLECSRSSLLGAAMQCSVTGLEPGPLGHAYLIPYGSEVQWIAGYRGLIDLAYRTGNLASVYAREVRESDHFKPRLGTDPIIEHVPNMDAPADEEIIAVYSVAVLKDGNVSFDLMSKQDIDRIKREKSQAGRQSPWHTDFNEMAKKTVFRRHSKWLPVSVEMRDAWHAVQGHDEQILDMDVDTGVTRNVDDQGDSTDDTGGQNPRQIDHDNSSGQVFDDTPDRQPEPARRESRHPNAPSQQNQQASQPPRAEQMHGAAGGQGGSDYEPEAPAVDERHEPAPNSPEDVGFGANGELFDAGDFPGPDVDPSVIESISHTGQAFGQNRAWQKENRSMSGLLRYADVTDDTKDEFRGAVAAKYQADAIEYVPPAWLKREAAALGNVDSSSNGDGPSPRNDYVHAYISAARKAKE